MIQIWYSCHSSFTRRIWGGLFSLTNFAQQRDDETIIHLSFISFFYPNANYPKRIASLVQDVGYNATVTTKHECNHPNFDPSKLRRIGIHQDITSTKAMFACRIAGFF
jgi:hypothetical protein